jgi:hypothetical protein
LGDLIAVRLPKWGTDVHAAHFSHTGWLNAKENSEHPVSRVIRWFKASEEFEAFVAVHDRVPEGTYAYDCFRGVSVPDDLRTVKAHLWLASSRRRNPDYIFEHSVSLPSYDSVLTLLYNEEVATALVDEEENLDELRPEDFTLNRHRWPR